VKGVRRSQAQGEVTSTSLTRVISTNHVDRNESGEQSPFRTAPRESVTKR